MVAIPSEGEPRKLYLIKKKGDKKMSKKVGKGRTQPTGNAASMPWGMKPGRLSSVANQKPSGGAGKFGEKVSPKPGKKAE
jgi:hypothetical protein